MKSAAKKAGLKGRVRVNAAGCIDQCEHGVTVVVYPEQVWYGFVTMQDVSEIVESHLIHGKPVERLRLAPGCVNTAHCPHREPGKS
jgi:(2Fe-2S) ferredoxin